MPQKLWQFMIVPAGEKFDYQTSEVVSFPGETREEAEEVAYRYYLQEKDAGRVIRYRYISQRYLQKQYKQSTRS